MSGVVRVSGPFVVEATIPTPVDLDGDELVVRHEAERSAVATDDGTPLRSVPDYQHAASDHADHITRMLEALRKSPVLRLPGNQTVAFKNVRAPAKALTLHAEAIVEGNGEKPMAFHFGPANGAVTERAVLEARMEAQGANYQHLYVIGFAFQESARKHCEQSLKSAGIAATAVNATMDIAMGDLLKTTKASQLFSVTGAPEVKLVRLQEKSPEGETLYRAELLGLDVYYPPGYDSTDPSKDDVEHESGENVPAWLLDTDYNELCFYVTQAFFPRTAAWNSLKRALGAQYDDSVWEHFAGTVSEPFTAGEHGKIAVKVIDDRGNELLVVKPLSEAEKQ